MIKRIVFLLAVVCLGTQASAQDKPGVHKINGKKYYLHVVEQGNTLYGISKQYGISIDDLQRENATALREGLKVNQTLLIPVEDASKEVIGVVEQQQGHIVHKVQPKETLYSISKQYNTTLEVILEANPGIRDEGLKADTEIHIPVNRVEARKELVQPAKPDSLEGYIVKKGETLYSISKRFKVSMDDLIRYNDGLQFGLKEGMAIRIPGQLTSEAAQAKVETGKSDTATTDTIPHLHFPQSARKFEIGLLLPLNPHFPDSATRHDFKISEASRVALSFYRGFRYACDSLVAGTGLELEVHLFDTGKDSSSIERVMRSRDFDSVDVVIGPFYTEQFEYVADEMGKRGVPVVCPMPKPSKLLFNRPNAIKTTPSESMQLHALAAFAAQNLRDSNLCVVNSNRFQDQENLEFFKAEYGRALGLPDTFLQDAIREVKLWDINHETLVMRFPDSGSYVLIVPSTSTVFITKLLSELYNLAYESGGSYRFRVIGMEEWQRHDENIDIKHLHLLNVTLPLAFYLDLESYRVKQFYRQYYLRHGYEPDQFTVQGFDLGSYLIRQLHHHPAEWFAKPESFTYHGVSQNFDFKRIMPASGVENQYIQLYEYDHYRMKEFGRWPAQKMK